MIIDISELIPNLSVSRTTNNKKLKGYISAIEPTKFRITWEDNVSVWFNKTNKSLELSNLYKEPNV